MISISPKRRLTIVWTITKGFERVTPLCGSQAVGFNSGWKDASPTDITDRGSATPHGCFAVVRLQELLRFDKK